MSSKRDILDVIGSGPAGQKAAIGAPCKHTHVTA